MREIAKAARESRRASLRKREGEPASTSVKKSLTPKDKHAESAPRLFEGESRGREEGDKRRRRDRHEQSAPEQRSRRGSHERPVASSRHKEEVDRHPERRDRDRDRDRDRTRRSSRHAEDEAATRRNDKRQSHPTHDDVASKARQEKVAKITDMVMQREAQMDAAEKKREDRRRREGRSKVEKSPY